MKEADLPVAGLTTLPLNNPLDSETLNESLLSPRFVNLFAASWTEFEKAGVMFPPEKAMCPSVMLIPPLVELAGRTYVEPDTGKLVANPVA